MHQVEARLARWLLTSSDRWRSDALNLVHKFLAQMLGVQRSTATVAAGDLQRAGLINYSRGKVEILDRKHLIALACKCYEIVTSTYERMLRIDPDNSLHYVA